MPSVDHNDLVLRVEGLGTESAAQWAAKAVTMGASSATITDGQHGLRLVAQFDASDHGRGPSNLANLLVFACEVEGVSADVVLGRIERRSVDQPAAEQG